MKPKHPTQIWLLVDLQENVQGSKLRVQITRYLPNITCLNARLNATPTEPRHSYFVVKIHVYMARWGEISQNVPITPQVLHVQSMGQ